MAIDLYTLIVVGCLVFIWIVLGVMFKQEYWPRKNTQTPGRIIPRGEVLVEVVGSTQVTCSSPFITPGNGSDVTITVDPPLCEADTSNGGTQANQNGAPEGEGSSSSGSTDGSHSDMSSFQSLHSNDNAHRRTPGDTKSSQSSSMSRPGTLASTENASYAKDSNLTPGDTKSSQPSIMSRPGTLASTENASYVDDPKVIPPIATLRSEKVTYSSYSDDFSQPATLASTESAPHNGASQSSQVLHVGQPLSEVGGSSEISSWHSLRSTESPLRRPLQDDVGVSPSLPALLHSISEKDPEDITNRQRKKMHTV